VTLKVTAPPRPALRVATAVTLAVIMVYAAAVAGILVLVSQKLVHQTDGHLGVHLIDYRQASAMRSPASVRLEADGPPVYLWRVSSLDAVVATSTGAPSLPMEILAAKRSVALTAAMSGRDFRFAQIALADGSRVFAAESLTGGYEVQSVLLKSALLVSPVLLVGVFASAFGIWRRASKPIEDSRRRELEFTANASRELRTPLTAIQSTVELALAAPGTAGGYRRALQAVAGESVHLRRSVEDLLWLARLESEPPASQTEVVDVVAVARRCAAHYEPIVRAEHVLLNVELTDDGAAQIVAVGGWLDRLVSVLLENAIRCANAPGQVLLRIDSSRRGVSLTVAHDGPAIPLAARGRSFHRFWRIDENAGEDAGLGTAIADAVVRSTHGQWMVDASTLPVASVTVNWPRLRSAGGGNCAHLRRGRFGRFVR
jgi:signal transduction histidine kinase